MKSVGGSNNGPELVNPLLRVPEAYYRFQSGDSVSFLLPDGTRGRLREVKVEARQPRSDLLVGSLWFETKSDRLVRAVYRPSLPLNIVEFVEATEKDAFDDVPKLVKPMIFPMSLEVTALTVEYELHEQRWWLPRTETMTGRMRIGFMRAPFTREESYRYDSVNGTDSLPPIFGSASDSARSAEHDSTRRMREQAMRDAMRDSTAGGAGTAEDGAENGETKTMPSSACFTALRATPFRETPYATAARCRFSYGFRAIRRASCTRRNSLRPFTIRAMSCSGRRTAKSSRSH